MNYLWSIIYHYIFFWYICNMKELCMHYFIGTMAKRLQSAALFNPIRVFSLVSHFLRVCVHIICLEIALISINRIESHCICRLSLHFNFPFVMRIYIIAILIWTVCWRIRINDPENSTLLPFTNCLTSLRLPLTRSLFYLEKCQLHIWVFKVGIFNDFIS